MQSFSVAASAFRIRLEGFADWLYGCAHHRTSLPVTLRTGDSVEGRPSTQSETYIVCLDCGRHIPYDWSTMRAGSKRASRVWTRLGFCSTEDKIDVAQERLRPEALKSGSHGGAEAQKERR